MVRDPALRGAPEVEWACGVLLLAAAVAVSLAVRSAWRLALVAGSCAVVADIIGMTRRRT